jgi:hypothetical protein
MKFHPMFFSWRESYMTFHELMEGHGFWGGGPSGGGATTPPPAGVQPLARQLVSQKHLEYGRAATRYRAVYYCSRIAAGLCAGLLPFVVSTQPNVATGLAIAVVAVTVLDLVFSPKDKWQLYSRATDLLAVEIMKQEGSYEQYRRMIDVIVKTETASLQRLISIDEIVSSIQKQ